MTDTNIGPTLVARILHGETVQKHDIETLSGQWKTITEAIASSSDPNATYRTVVSRMKNGKAHNVKKAVAEAADVLYGTPLSVLSADSILTTDWPEPPWIVPDFLPMGLTNFAGRPKLGKSWLALQLALSKASGGVALGRHVEQGPVLYLALEDPLRRLADRMRQQQWPTNVPADFMVLQQFQEEIGDLAKGGSATLARQIKRKGYHLVIIDTLSRSVGGDQDDVSAMTLALNPLHEIAHECECAILLIDHHRKAGSANPDAIADILGSTAKGAMSDTVWGLYRERGKAVAKLYITGRDIEEQQLDLKMDWLTGCWQLEGDSNELKMTPNRKEVLRVLVEQRKATLADVCSATGKQKGNVHRTLQDLVSHGYATKTKDAYGPTEKGIKRDNNNNSDNVDNADNH